MSESRVEGDYDLLDEASERLSQIASDLEGVVKQLDAERVKLEEAWPDRVGAEFTERVDTAVKTLDDIRSTLEDRSRECHVRAEQMRAVHENL